jgi:hypothetical protein
LRILDLSFVTELRGYCDSDGGDDSSSSKSTSGYLFSPGHGAGRISWRSKLLPITAKTVAEAEYTAAHYAGQEAVYLRNLLSDLGFTRTSVTAIYEENTACRAMSQNPVLHASSKHILRRYHYIRELVDRGFQVLMTDIKTTANTVDALT